MVRSAFFYITRFLLFLPATFYGLVRIARDGNFETLKFYPLGLGLLFTFFYLFGRSRKAAADSPPPQARGRGILLFALLQFHWAILIIPILSPAYLWVGAACLAVLAGGVFAGTARPLPNPMAILIALGILIFSLGGERLAGANPPDPLLAFADFFPGQGFCFWSLFFERNACSLAETHPETLLLSLLVFLVVARNHIWELGLALLLAGVAGIEWGLFQGGLVGAMSAAVLLAPGRERRTLRAWTAYILIWVSVYAGLTFSSRFAPDFYFYFKNNGAGNSWLFWMIGLFLAELSALVLRFWRERGLLTGNSARKAS